MTGKEGSWLMFIVLEIDKHFTLGVDLYKNIIGVRLGFIALHIVLFTFTKWMDATTEVINNKIAKEEKTC
jgi:hypothetical protein